MLLRRSIYHLQTRSVNPPWIPSSFSYSDFPIKKTKLAPLQERKMVDRFRLWAKGGEGGNGCWSIRRSRQDRRGKPDGGNGGRGGDVILECSAAVWDFSNLQHHLNAKRGGHGASKNKIGSRGADKVAKVPVGTVIHLVMGDVPSLVENRSVTSLQPWEIPSTGTVEVSSEFNQHFKTTTHSTKEVASGISEGKVLNNISSCIERKKKLDSMRQPIRGSKKQTAQSHKRLSKAGMEGHVSYDSEQDMSEGDYIEADYGMSEAEWEEEDEEEVIKFSVAELTEPGRRLVVARGGEGGLGSDSLGTVSKSHKLVNCGDNDISDLEISDDENESSITVGLRGSEVVLILELKSIADVGLVGIPNAGKSTLLGTISRAKPTIGDYAFTTLRPNIGNLNYEDFFSVTVADIPGIIKGAHENRGLGHAFLRHIERTKVLAYVVDLAAALDGRKGIPPWEQLRDLVLELEYHHVGLSDRPSIVVANKIDEMGAEEVYEELKRRVHGVPIYPVCAVLEEGIPELKAGLRKLVEGRESRRLELSEIMVD